VTFLFSNPAARRLTGVQLCRKTYFSGTGPNKAQIFVYRLDLIDQVGVRSEINRKGLPPAGHYLISVCKDCE